LLEEKEEEEGEVDAEAKAEAAEAVAAAAAAKAAAAAAASLRAIGPRPSSFATGRRVPRQEPAQMDRLGHPALRQRRVDRRAALQQRDRPGEIA
jgi:hypothetical protein